MQWLAPFSFLPNDNYAHKKFNQMMIDSKCWASFDSISVSSPNYNDWFGWNLSMSRWNFGFIIMMSRILHNFLISTPQIPPLFLELLRFFSFLYPDLIWSSLFASSLWKFSHIRRLAHSIRNTTEEEENRNAYQNTHFTAAHWFEAAVGNEMDWKFLCNRAIEWISRIQLNQ